MKRLRSVRGRKGNGRFVSQSGSGVEGEDSGETAEGREESRRGSDGRGIEGGPTVWEGKYSCTEAQEDVSRDG